MAQSAKLRPLLAMVAWKMFLGPAPRWLRVRAIQRRLPGVHRRSNDRHATGQGPAVRTTQRLSGTVDRGGAGGIGSLRRPAVPLDAGRLPHVAIGADSGLRPDSSRWSFWPSWQTTRSTACSTTFRLSPWCTCCCSSWRGSWKRNAQRPLQPAAFRMARPAGNGRKQ